MWRVATEAKIKWRLSLFFVLLPAAYIKQKETKKERKKSTNSQGGCRSSSSSQEIDLIDPFSSENMSIAPQGIFFFFWTSKWALEVYEHQRKWSRRQLWHRTPSRMNRVQPMEDEKKKRKLKIKYLKWIASDVCSRVLLCWYTV